MTETATWTEQTDQRRGAANSSKRPREDERDTHREPSGRWRFGSAVQAARALNAGHGA